MAEYIEREALYEKAYWHGEMPDLGHPYAEGVEAVDISDVDAIPAADVAPKVNGTEGGREGGLGHVVRCKDCKHMNIVGVGYRWCKVWERIQTMGDEGFCNFGERRADN